MLAMAQATLSSRATRLLSFLFLASLAFIVSLLFAPSANAVSGPIPSPGFTIVEQKCKEVGKEQERQFDGYETITTTNPDGTTTTTRREKYKTVIVTITQCDWIERKVTTGKGVWIDRPELMKSVPCEAIEVFGLDPEEVKEFCENGAANVDFPVRNFPQFADPDARYAYQEITIGDFDWGGFTGGGDGKWKHITDPSTVGLSNFPCWLTALDNSNPTIEILDNLSIDEIDWAKFVNYKLTYYNQASITFRSPNSQKPLLVTKSGPSHIGASGETLSLINSDLVSTADWLSCEDALGGRGGGTSTVRVLCPVYYTNVTIDGPYGNDLPSLSDRKNSDPNSIRNVAMKPGPHFTEFGNIWKQYISPRRYKDNALAAIDMVRKCGAMTKASIPLNLPYLGNYDIDAKLHYTTCSYSLMPGFSNGAYFGGCTGALSWKPIAHTIHARCDGLVRPGAAAAGTRFDAETCYNMTCRWSNTSSAFIYGKDAPQGMTSGSTHFPDGANIPLRPNPTHPGARPDGTPLLWDGSLNRMIVRDSISNRRVGFPVSGEDKKFSVFQVDPESSPWNPRVPQNRPNHPDQWFKAMISETRQTNPLAFVPNGVEPKNVAEGKRFTDWNNLNINVYQASREGGALRLRFHRVETWNVPLRLGSTTGIFEYGITPGPVRTERREPTLTCSTQWSAINYVGNRLQAPNTLP